MDSNEGGASREYPGADLAYDIAVESFALAERRRDAVHQRIDVLLSFVTTVTVAAPVIVASVFQRPDFNSPLLLAAGGVYTLLVLGALGARLVGSLRQVSPKLLYERWLHLEEPEFKRRMIYWAGEYADEARKLTNLKALAATVMAVLFVVEGALFLAWIVRLAQGD
ncbi:MAG: hypothetical protein OXH12_04765 [Chloroflexi bacterium]|nr:hypothetical protein [Chloroflexota bacterium]